MNADDLGYTDGINAAVLTLHTEGALSSATVMAGGQAVKPLVRQLGRSGGLGQKISLGCHVVLVDGWPLSTAALVPSLLLRESGSFRPRLGAFALDLLRGRVKDGELEREAVAQIRSLQALGMRVTHLDTHKHTHLFPRVLRPLLRAALQCGVRAVRNPFEPRWARAATREAGVARRIQVSLLSRYRATFLEEVERAGLQTTAGALGVLATGVLQEPVLESLLEALARHGGREECYELVCHPGLADAALRALPTRLQGEREEERRALALAIPRWTGPEGPHRLVSFADLADA